LGDFFRGARYVLAHRRLYKWVALPFLLSLLLLATIAWGLWALSAVIIAFVVALMPAFLAVLVGGLLHIVVLALLAIGAYVLFFGVAALITTPFCEMLSEAVEEERTGVPAPPFSVGVFLRDLVLGISHALRRVFLFLVSVLAMLLLGAVLPVVGVFIAAIATAFITSRFAAFDAMDCVLARKGWRYKAKKQFLAEHRARTLGLGAAVAGMSWIPLVGALALPFGAVGATLLYLDVTDESKGE